MISATTTLLLLVLRDKTRTTAANTRCTPPWPPAWSALSSASPWSRTPPWSHQATLSRVNIPSDDFHSSLPPPGGTRLPSVTTLLPVSTVYSVSRHEADQVSYWHWDNVTLGCNAHLWTCDTGIQCSHVSYWHWDTILTYELVTLGCNAHLWLQVTTLQPVSLQPGQPGAETEAPLPAAPSVVSPGQNFIDLDLALKLIITIICPLLSDKMSG